MSLCCDTRGENRKMRGGHEILFSFLRYGGIEKTRAGARIGMLRKIFFARMNFSAVSSDLQIEQK
jgi:hypothetical protein